MPTTAAARCTGTTPTTSTTRARAPGRGRRHRPDPHHRHAAGIRGRPRQRADPAQRGRHPLHRAVVGRQRAAADYAEAYERLVWTAHHWQHWLARGHFPDHPWRSYLQRSALTLKGLTYAPTGAICAAATTSLPETHRRRAELRLPLHLDPRLDVRAVGDVLAGLRLGGRRLLLLHRRRRRAATQTCRSCTASAASGTSPSTNSITCRATPTRARCGSGTWPAPSTSTTSGARSWTRSTCTARPRDHIDPRIWPLLGTHVQAALKHWREPDAGHLGGSRRAEALHLVEDHVLGRGRPRRQAGDDDRRARGGVGVGGRRRGDQGRHPRPRCRRARRAHPALRHDLARRVAAARGTGPVPAARRPAHPRDGRRDRRRADRARPGAALPHRARPTTASPARRARSRSARSGWCRRCARSASTSARGSCARSCCRSPARSSSTPRRLDPHSGRQLGNFPQAFTHLALINAVLHVIGTERVEDAAVDEPGR